MRSARPQSCLTRLLVTALLAAVFCGCSAPPVQAPPAKLPLAARRREVSVAGRDALEAGLARILEQARAAARQRSDSTQVAGHELER